MSVSPTPRTDYAARLVLECDDDAEARAVESALAVEAAAPLPKAGASVERAGSDVTLALSARDAASLRAAVNSYLRWARVAVEAARAGREHGEG